MPPILRGGLDAAAFDDFFSTTPKLSFNHFFPSLDGDFLSASISFSGVDAFSFFFLALGILVTLLGFGLLAMVDFWAAVLRFWMVVFGFLAIVLDTWAGESAGESNDGAVGSGEGAEARRGMVMMISEDWIGISQDGVVGLG